MTVGVQLKEALYPEINPIKNQKIFDKAPDFLPKIFNLRIADKI